MQQAQGKESLEKSTQQINQLIEKGNFKIQQIGIKILGKNIEDISDSDIKQWNQVQLNMSINLQKENSINQNVPSLVQSEVFGDESIQPQTNFINDFMKSKINMVIQNMKNDTTDQQAQNYLNNIQDELQKQVFDNEFQQQVDMYYSNLIVQNQTQTHDQFAENYIGNLCKDILQNVKEQVVESVLIQNPKVDKKVVELFVDENLQEKQKNFEKSAKNVLDDFKQKIPNDNNKEMDGMLQQYWQQTLNTLEVSALQKTTVKNDKLSDNIKQNIEEEIGKQLTGNIEKNQKQLNASYLNLIKSTYYQGIIAEHITRQNNKQFILKNYR